MYADRIVKHFGLDGYFLAIDGSELDGARSDKGELIAHVLRRDGLTPADVLMIGDREHDMLGARSHGIRGIGVLWGYGSAAELIAAGATECIATPSQLTEAVQKVASTAAPTT